MRTVFEHHGIDIEVTSGESIHYRTAEDRSDSRTPDAPGNVGIGVHVVRMTASPDNGIPSGRSETVASFFMRPSEARALGSAILSAATEAHGGRRLL